MPESALARLALMAVPFIVWFAWRAWARHTGREMGATPWPWLFAAGAALAGLSLIAAAVLHPDNRRETYVPAQAAPDGSVHEGYFAPHPASPKTPPR
ncbi:hypothetical protein [Phenylobacterium sp.]|uniref:hypothetical protein n=1 Tax=Phenylobacterium sp. TaxID=1871053 RepID=UPI001204F8D1|nr:hypothetical protein [Phenylobacterium sp.]THD64330.1 MAG: hypothetical protein E8A49_02265 [Phenylobacterium sp.]